MSPDSTPDTQVSWPANHRAALIVIVAVDAPHLDGRTTGATGLDYAATGVQRLLALLADLGLVATTAWTPSALGSLPQFARRARDDGHELALGSLDWAVNDSAVLAHISNIAPSGVIEALPGQEMRREESAASLTGLSWVITGAGGDVPVLTVGYGRQDLVLIPVSPYWIDTAWLAPERPLPPSSLLEAWSLALASVRSDGGLMTIVLHPHVAGRPGFASQAERFLDEAIESGDVWIATAGDVADWWRRLHAADDPKRVEP